VVTHRLIGSMRCVALVWVACLGLGAGTAGAQEAYPNKRMEMVIPFGAGAATDIFARTVADGMSRLTGQTVVPINRPGANGLIAVRSVQSAPKDGHTFIILANGIVNEQVMKKDVDFDIRKDLIPVTRAVQAPLGLFVSNSLPVNSMKDLVEYVRKNPGKVNFASAALGSNAHLATERLMLATGMKMVHITYPGGTPQMNVALLSGDVGVFLNEMGSMKQLVNEKRIKVLATLDERRNPAYPDTPATPETGVPELRNFASVFFFGFFLAPGTDPARVERLSAEINRAIADPQTRERLIALGHNPALLGNSNPTDFRRAVNEELERVQKVVQDANIKVN